jgi:hypothetical protein
VPKPAKRNRSLRMQLIQMMMKEDEYIKELDHAWGFDGFLGKLREGEFDRKTYNDLHASLLKIDFEEHELINRELISLLWFIPICMYRQKEYFPGISSSEFDALREHLEEQLARIFRYP